MWNSTSRVTENGTKYELKQLSALFNYIGVQIDGFEIGKPLQKDDECEIHCCSYLDGITNGEYLYCLFQIFGQMISDEPADKDQPLYVEAVLASVLDGTRQESLDYLKEDYFLECCAKDIWELWRTIRATGNLPLWTDENDNSVEPPLLKDISAEDWERIFEEIYDEFLWDRDFELFGENLALMTNQPHWPTQQEFRTARAWLLDVFSKTPANRKEAKK